MLAAVMLSSCGGVQSNPGSDNGRPSNTPLPIHARLLGGQGGRSHGQGHAVQVHRHGQRHVGFCVIGTDTWTYYPTGSSAPVPDTKASYWDEQIPGDWRSAPVLVEPDDGKVYSGYQFRIDAFVDDRDLLDGWSENPRVNGIEPFRRFRWRMPAMWKTWRCLSTDVAPSADRHRGSHRGRRNARSPIGANGLCGSLWYQ